MPLLRGMAFGGDGAVLERLSDDGGGHEQDELPQALLRAALVVGPGGQPGADVALAERRCGRAGSSTKAAGW